MSAVAVGHLTHLAACKRAQRDGVPFSSIRTRLVLIGDSAVCPELQFERAQRLLALAAYLAGRGA